MIGVPLLLATVGAGIFIGVNVIPSWLDSGSQEPTATPSSSPGPTCATARVGGDAPLGVLAWVRDGALYLVDLDTCDERTLVPKGASAPVRFSPDGAWIAFGQGAIVPAQGGTAQSPLGELVSWQWSPEGDVLAGVTPGGGVVMGGPTVGPNVLLPEGSGAGHVAFSPGGRSLAIDVGGDQVQVLSVAGGRATTLYRVTPGTEAPTEVIGWSPDGRWVLFFSRFPNRTGIPLNAAPTVGGAWANVFDPVLPYPDFLSWCGRHLVLSGGAVDVPSQGNQILLSGPPRWRFANLSDDFTRSWLWPACSPDGRWIVATATPNRAEAPPGRGVRSLWLLATDGKARARLTHKPDNAYELPRWSADGRFVLVVRRGLAPDSPGALLLLRVDPSSGKARRVPGVVARLGPAPGERGHADWSQVSDWYQPP